MSMSAAIHHDLCGPTPLPGTAGPHLATILLAEPMVVRRGPRVTSCAMAMLRAAEAPPPLMPDFHVVPLSKTLLVEGRGRRETFRGLVLAIGWWESAGGAGAPTRASLRGGVCGPELHYLVSDQTK